MFALAVVCAVLLAKPPRRRVPAAARLLLVFMTLALATTVAVTMIAWGAHTFTEALAGAAVGTGVALACALALDLLTSRAWRAQQRSPAGRTASAEASPALSSRTADAAARVITQPTRAPWRYR
jgi:membrane-associated phospholipid phosphatase